MAHDHRPRTERFEEAREIGRRIARRVEWPEAGKALVDLKPGRTRCLRESPRQRPNGQSLADRDAPPEDGAEPVAGIAQPDALLPAPVPQGLEKLVADARQHVDVLVPVDEVGRTPEGALEGGQLAVDLFPDLGQLKLPEKGPAQHLGKSGKGAVGRQLRHGPERRAQGQVQVQADAEPLAGLIETARQTRPPRAVRHGGGR
jgi:hypothetical protein